MKLSRCRGVRSDREISMSPSVVLISARTPDPLPVVQPASSIAAESGNKMRKELLIFLLFTKDKDIYLQ